MSLTSFDASLGVTAVTSSPGTRSSNTDTDEKTKQQRLTNAIKSRKKRARRKAFEQELQNKFGFLSKQKKALLAEHHFLVEKVERATRIVESIEITEARSILLSNLNSDLAHRNSWAGASSPSSLLPTLRELRACRASELEQLHQLSSLSSCYRSFGGSPDTLSPTTLEQLLGYHHLPDKWTAPYERGLPFRMH